MVSQTRPKLSINQQEIIDFVSDLIRINTTNPPGNEYLCKDLIFSKFREIGLKVQTYEPVKGRTNFEGEIGKGKPSVALIGHLDTVSAGGGWKTNPFQAVLKNGRIYGRGASDNKGPLVAVWAAVKAFLRCSPSFKGKIFLVAACDEETGSEFGIRALIRNGFKVDCALVPDAGYIDQAVIGEKGICRFEIECFGKEAHGASPYRGSNAIVPLAFLISALSDFGIDKKIDKNFKPLTVNIGTIEGGSAANVVPAYAKVAVDIRYPPPVTLKEVENEITRYLSKTQQQFPQAKLKLNKVHVSTPHIIDISQNRLIQSFAQSAKMLGLDLKYKTTGGNTVAKFLVEAGMSAFCHSPSRIAVGHMPNEYVVIADLVLAARLYALTLIHFFNYTSGV